MRSHLLLPLLALAAAHPSLGAPPEERVIYSLKWWVGNAGEVTKTYDVLYAGKNVTELLKDYSIKDEHKDLARVTRLLPLLEASDQLAESRRDGTHYYFRFKGKPQPPETGLKEQVQAQLPPINDPIVVPWSSIDGSHFRYKVRDLHFENRLEIRVPWKFDNQIEPATRPVNAAGIASDITVGPIDKPSEDQSAPGWDQKGFEISQVIVTREGEWHPSEVKDQWLHQPAYIQSRLQGVVLTNPENRIDDAFEGPRNHWAGLFRYGYEQISFGPAADPGFNVAFGVFVERRFSTAFNWKILAFEANIDFNHLSSEPTSPNFTNYGLQLASLAEYRVNFHASSQGKRPFVELYAGPVAEELFVNDNTATLYTSGLAAGLMAGFKAGVIAPTTNPILANIGIAINVRWTQFFATNPASSVFMLGLETF